MGVTVVVGVGGSVGLEVKVAIGSTTAVPLCNVGGGDSCVGDSHRSSECRISVPQEAQMMLEAAIRKMIPRNLAPPLEWFRDRLFTTAPILLSRRIAEVVRSVNLC